MKRNKLLVLILVLNLVLSMVIPAYAVAENGQALEALKAFDNKIINNIDLDKAMYHVEYMSKVIGSRPSGLKGEKLAAAYIENYFKNLGLETLVQSFDVNNQYIGNITVHDADKWYGKGEWGFNEWHGDVWETGAAANGLITGENVKVSGYVIDCGSGNIGEWPAEVEGNIALVERGITFNTLRDRAVEAGAKGLLVYSVTGSRGNYGSAFSPSITTSDIPVLGLALAQGQWLKEMIAAELPVYVDTQTFAYTDLTSQNVIAIKPAKKANAPIVIIGGHYDSVVGSVGANDNLSGTALVMELARVLNKFKTDDYELRFAAWGSEERGLLGARYYVNTMSDEELNRHIANFNGDMVATSEYERAPYFQMQTVDGNPNLVTDAMMDAASRLLYTELRQGTFSSSDHVPFHQAGIPASLFIWLGGEGTPSNYTIERFYHTPQDTIEENFCTYRMQLALEVTGAAVFDLVRKPVPALQNSAIRRDFNIFEFGELLEVQNPEF
jgi:aminopeptidase YwaD